MNFELLELGQSLLVQSLLPLQKKYLQLKTNSSGQSLTQFGLLLTQFYLRSQQICTNYIYNQHTLQQKLSDLTTYLQAHKALQLTLLRATKENEELVGLLDQSNKQNQNLLSRLTSQQQTILKLNEVNGCLRQHMQLSQQKYDLLVTSLGDKAQLLQGQQDSRMNSLQEEHASTVVQLKEVMAKYLAVLKEGHNDKEEVLVLQRRLLDLQKLLMLACQWIGGGDMKLSQIKSLEQNLGPALVSRCCEVLGRVAILQQQ